jgi:type IV secretion system protein TrbL
LRVLALSLLAAVSAVTLLKYEQYKVDDIVAAFGLSVLSIALLIANIKAPAAAAALINSGPVLDGAMAWQALRAGATEGFKNMSNTVKTGAAAGKAAGGPAGGVSAMVVGVAQQVWNKGTNSYGNSSQNSKSQNQSSSNGAQGQYGPGSYKGGWSSQNRQSSNQASGGSQAASNP